MNNINESTLTWRTEVRRVDDLVPYEQNPRTLSATQLTNLKKSLKKFNLVEIPAIDPNNRVIAGHQRLKVLKLLGRGQEEIDVRVPNRPLTEDEYQQYMLTSNAVTGDWDFEKLKSFDFDLLQDVGFDDAIMEKIWAEHIDPVKEEDFDEEAELATIINPTTKDGDLIILGPHRLVCGSCTEESTIERLFRGIEEKATMIYSDPPYNIDLDYNKGIGGKQSYGAEVYDSRTDEEYRTFITKSLNSSLTYTSPNAHVFYWCDQIYIGLIQEVFTASGVTNKRVCLWIKNGQNPTPGVAFNKCYEPCIYGVLGKPYIAPSYQSYNEVMNSELESGNDLITGIHDHLDIWPEKRLSGNNYEHATSKPPSLHERAIRRCTKPNNIIIDSFGGSGSTLIAADGLKRRAFLVEQQPRFCDLIIRRYKKLTGTKAIIEHS